MAFVFLSVKQFYPITLQVETLITAITSTMDESKRVERELVAIQERQVGEDDTNSGCLKIPHFSVLVPFGLKTLSGKLPLDSSAERRS